MARPRRGLAPSVEHRLHEAFWSLALEPSANINVSAVCARAGCNRTSFYYHYVDIYGLVDEAVEVEYRGASGFREIALFLACEYRDDEEGLRVALSLANPKRLRAADDVLGPGYVEGLVRGFVAEDWARVLEDRGAQGLAGVFPLIDVAALALVGALMDSSAEGRISDPLVARFFGRGFDLVLEAAGLR